MSDTPTPAELRQIGYAPKVYHRAANVNHQTGAVSALCYRRPRAIDLRAASWTLRDDAVTCPKCLRIIGDSGEAVPDAD